jgi:hypothetical protein
MTTTTPPPAAPAALQRSLHGLLDNPAVDRLEAELRRLGPLPAVELDAAGLTDIDPVAATRLFLLCERLERTHDCTVQLARLPHPIRRRLRFHPLLAFLPTEDGLFRDPFASDAPSGR